MATPAVAQTPPTNIHTAMQAKVHAKSQLQLWGWSGQWRCLHALWNNESNWRPLAKNKIPVVQVRNGKRVKLYAGGIPQVLGLSPHASVSKQVQTGFAYIKHRYENPCKALAFWNRHSWY